MYSKKKIDYNLDKTETDKKPCEDRARRQRSVRQGERPQKKQNLPASDFGLLEL